MNILFRNLQPHLIELSDVGLQRKLWLNEDNDTGLNSSFTELYNGITFECALDKILDDPKYWQDMSIDVITELRKLLEELKEFANKTLQLTNRTTLDIHESMMRDPEWAKVSNHAERILRLWDSKEINKS